jgi:hypothetical protein
MASFIKFGAKQWQDYEDWQALAVPILCHCGD